LIHTQAFSNLSTDKTGQFPVSLLLSHKQINTSGYPSLRAERKLFAFPAIYTWSQ